MRITANTAKMPNMAFSPGPQQPLQVGGEKENSASNGKNISDTAASRRHSSGGSDRTPLENLSAETDVVLTSPAAPTAGSGPVVCKRDSSCKCPDCDMAASVFGIDQLRQVGGGNLDGGGVARSPVPTSSGAIARTPILGDSSSGDVHDGGGKIDDVGDTVVAPAANSSNGAVDSMTTARAVAVVGNRLASPQQKFNVEEAKGSPAISTIPTATPAAEDMVVDDSSSTAAATTAAVAMTTPARSNLSVTMSTPKEADTPSAAPSDSNSNSGSKKKSGWGFKMARAVFSPGSAIKKKDKSKGGERTGRTSSGASSGSENVPLREGTRHPISLTCLICSWMVVGRDSREDQPEVVFHVQLPRAGLQRVDPHFVGYSVRM